MMSVSDNIFLFIGDMIYSINTTNAIKQADSQQMILLITFNANVLKAYRSTLTYAIHFA